MADVQGGYLGPKKYFDNSILLLGTYGANLSHFWRANDLVKFKNFERFSQPPKYHSLGNPVVIFHMVASLQKGDIIICSRQFFEWGSNLSHFGLFVLGSTHFLQSF